MLNSTIQSNRHTNWKELIEEHEKSGLSQTEFCKKNEIDLAKFGYHRGRMKSKDNNSTGNKKLFTPIQIKKNEINSSAEIRIILPNGFQCFIPTSTEICHVKRLIEALLSC
jgi:hypothetical protein